MKCKKGFKEESGKCVKEKIDTYCDANVLLAFSNRDRLRIVLGRHGYDRFKDHIVGKQYENSERNSRRLNSCVIDRETLLNDIDYHKASVGAVLTATGLRRIKVKNINGEEEGKKAYSNACAKVEKGTHFHNQFCDGNKIKENLDDNNLNDVRHFGSAIKFNSKVFLTSNTKDFKPLMKVTNIKVEGE